MTVERRRDAARSRAAILDAAELLFAERGPLGTSLHEIAAAAGLSRGTPSYFFGSKEALYRAVLARVFAARDEAAREAFAGVRAWAAGEGDGDRGDLEPALAAAIADYVAFLLRRPAFARLVQWESLVGGTDLREASRGSTAMAEAFGAVRAVAAERGLRPFEPDDAVLVLVSLAFSPLTQRSTFLAALARDLDDAETARRHVALVARQVLYLLRGS